MNRTDEADRERLANAMDVRRKQIRKTWEEIAAEAGISTTHIRKFRRGENNFGDIVRAAVEEALHWEQGAFTRILNQEEPVPLRQAGRTGSAEGKAAEPVTPDQEVDVSDAIEDRVVPSSTADEAVQAALKAIEAWTAAKDAEIAQKIEEQTRQFTAKIDELSEETRNLRDELRRRRLGNDDQQRDTA